MNAVWREDRLREFWATAVERHEMFHRRVLQRQPPPWTQDLVLGSIHLTYPYRELDRGTRFLIKHVLAPAVGDVEGAVFNALVYRIFNKIETYQALGGYRRPEEWALGDVAKRLARRQRAGCAVFTNAYMVSGIGSPPGVGGKVKLVVQRLRWAQRHLRSLTKQLQDTPSMLAAHAVLTQIPGIGPFNAYELVVDLCYGRSVLSFNEDEWAHAGPGALRGLSYLRDTEVRAGEALGLMRALRDEQERRLEEFKLRLRGPRFTLRGIEHWCCEFQKVVRARSAGRIKRGYRATEANADYTLWDRLDQKFLDVRCWVHVD